MQPFSFSYNISVESNEIELMQLGVARHAWLLSSFSLQTYWIELSRILKEQPWHGNIYHVAQKKQDPIK